MENSKVTTFIDSMNKKVLYYINSNKIDNTNTWIAFVDKYNEERNSIEVAYDSGEGSLIKVCYYGFKEDTDIVLAHAAVENIRVNNAIMNITNMRRHGFKDAMDLAERDNITEKGRYLYFREHAKEWTTSFNEGAHAYYDASSESWAKRLCTGCERVFNVGEKRQRKVGVSGSDAVLNSQFKQRIEEAKSTVELIDDNAAKLVALGAKFDDVFQSVAVKIDSSNTHAYMNPYTRTAFATMPCVAQFRLNFKKLDYKLSDTYRNSYSVFEVKYKLTYDEATSAITAEDIAYSTDFAYNDIRVVISATEDITMNIRLNDDLSATRLFPGKADLSIEDIEVPVSKAATRINRLAKLVEMNKANL